MLEHDFANAKHAWYLGGKLNVSYNCLDRHLETPRRNQAALVWEGDNPAESKTLTYQQLHREVCRFANVLKKRGVKKGDRVAFFVPNVPAMLEAQFGTLRIGAILVALNIRLSSRQIAYILNHSGAKVLFCDSALATVVR